MVRHPPSHPQCSFSHCPATSLLYFSQFILKHNPDDRYKIRPVTKESYGSVILQKLTVAQPLKESSLYGTVRFITLFTRAGVLPRQINLVQNLQWEECPSNIEARWEYIGISSV
jgi:hypothetical protein